VREHYLRDDISSGSPLDPDADVDTVKLSADAKQYLVVDTNIVLQQVSRHVQNAGREAGCAVTQGSAKRWTLLSLVAGWTPMQPAAHTNTYTHSAPTRDGMLRLTDGPAGEPGH
jgi:hypothetical protein